MEAFWWLFAIVLMALGLIGTVIPIVPGTTIILAAAVVHRLVLGADRSLGWSALIAMLVLTLLTYVIDAAALDFAAGIREAVVELHANPQAGPFWQPWHGPFLGGPATVMIGWLAVVLLGLTGRRRAAAAIASIALALGLFDLLAVLIQQSRAWTGGLPMVLITAGQGPVFIASLAACSLAFSAGPRRGLAIAGRRRACLMIAGLSVAFGFTEVVYLVRPSVSLTGSAFSFLGVLTLAVAAVITHVRGTVGWRVSALVAGPALLLDAVAIPFAGSSTASVPLSVASLLFAVLVWPVAIASWRGRVRRSSHALPT